MKIICNDQCWLVPWNDERDWCNTHQQFTPKQTKQRNK